MNPRAKRWTTVSDSAFDHEREALAFLRRMLPDSDPIRVWANFEFIARTGAMYEVDALVVTSAGVFLVEIKSYPGEISGDAGTWKWSRPDSSLATFDNPRILANRKAKHLAALIARTEAFRRSKVRVPFVQEVIFLSDPDLRVRLAPQGQFHVFGRDPEGEDEEIPPFRRSIGGVVEELLRLEPGRDGRLVRRVDRPTSELIARSIDEIGIRERTSRRRVGDYHLGELLTDVESDSDTGVAYQDFLANHVSLLDVQRRIRIYPLEFNATANTREIAERAAKREFRLLHQLDHSGILAPHDYTDTDRGPALVFDYSPSEQPLHRWLEEPAVKESLSVKEGLGVIRLIAEALNSAHQSGVTHRALSPSAVMVSGDPLSPQVRISNWHTGARVATGETSTTGTSGTSHIEALAAHDTRFYRAPEFAQPRPRPTLLDVFSLGAVATLIFTQRPPAETLSAYNQMLVETGYIPAEVIGDGLDPHVAEFIAEATATDPAERLESVADFLTYLDLVEEYWQQAEGPVEPPPDDARRGDYLASGRFEVKHRLGKGSTSIALEVIDHERGGSGVLKIASDPSQNERLEAEGGAIRALVHRNIVRLLDGPMEIGGHTALLLSHAGSTTLAARMADQPMAELAERFGEDLIEAVRHLEQQGVSHRDIKPENIGVTKMGANDELHLVLFDFSLANAPLDQIAAGTEGYIDPFLRIPARQSWDLHAERYSAAITLFEMLTGFRPTYGDGAADPVMTDADLSIDRSMFERSIAGGLVEFFSRALARKVDSRFDTADDMLRAWKRAFEAATQPATPTDGVEVTDGTHLDIPVETTLSTSLVGLPLSNRAVNALEREEVLLVGDLLEFPLSRLPQIRGVGSKTRREISEAVTSLRTALESGILTEGDTFGDPSAHSVLEIAEGLIPTRSSEDHETRTQVLRAVIGLDDSYHGWPTQAEVAQRVGVSRGRVSQIVTAIRSRWVRQPPVNELRDWISSELWSAGGVVTADQLAAALREHRPDGQATQDEFVAASIACVRAALVAEEENKVPRWARRRRGPSMIVAMDLDDQAGSQALADYAIALADATDSLVLQQGVVSRREFLDAVAEVKLPGGTLPIPEAHLADLAAGLSQNAAINARLELYPVGMAAELALRFARRSFAAVADVAPQTIREKVRARFPAAEELPGRPDLDDLLKRVGLELIWDDESKVYLAPHAVTETSSTTTTFRRHPTGVPTDLTPVEVTAADEFDSRLRRSLDNGGLLVLVTDESRLEDARRQLESLPVTLTDLDTLLLDQLREISAAGRPSWEVLVEADAAGPGTADWVNLNRVIDRALEDASGLIFENPGTVVVSRLGLLARYDRLDIVSQWRESLHAGKGKTDAVWLLAETSERSSTPSVDGKPIPVLTGGEWARIPREWLENAHRAGATS